MVVYVYAHVCKSVFACVHRSPRFDFSAIVFECSRASVGLCNPLTGRLYNGEGGLCLLLAAVVLTKGGVDY